MMTDYYHIDVYDRESKDYCFWDKVPQSIYWMKPKMAKGVSVTERYPENVVISMSDEESGKVLTDFIGNSKLCMIVSGRVKTVIESMCGEQCEYLPVSIENHRKRIASSDYFFINPLGTYDCLNKKASVIDYTDDGQVIDVEKFVFDPLTMNDVSPLFRVPEDFNCYFARASLIDAIREAIPDVTNLHLEPIEAVEGDRALNPS